MVVALPGLALLAALLVAWGLIYAGRAFVDALFGILGLVLKFSGLGVVFQAGGWVWRKLGGNPIDPISRAHQYLADKLGAASDAIGGAVAMSWHVLASIVEDTGWVIQNLGVAVDRLRAFVTDLEHFAKLIVGTSAFALAVRAIAKGLSDVIDRTSTITKMVAAPLTSPVGAAIKVVTKVDKVSLSRFKDWTRHRLDVLQAQIAHAGAVALPLPGTAVGDLREWVQRLDKRIGRVGTKALPYIASGVFVATLARFGLGWLRCDNVKKAGRGVCRMDTSALDALLVGSTLLVSGISIREFARELEASMGEATSMVRSFVREK